MLRPCPDIIRNSNDLLGVLVEEKLVTTEVRLLHLSMEIPRPRTKISCVPTHANGANIKTTNSFSGACHVTISLIFVNRFLDFSTPRTEFQQCSSPPSFELSKACLET
jgi:hypothetical protein